ncbi:MAG: response regulator [Magnetococcales bacterium]|nr:response regulator [Magnetococcales bacterium]
MILSEFFSIGGRVAMGFILVLLILVVQGMASMTAMNVSADHFAAFQRASATTSLIHAMESNVVELQRSVLAYTFSGYEGVLSRIQRVQERLNRQLEQLRPELQDQRRLDLLKRMEGHFRSHSENFLAAIEEHRLRDRLAEQEVDRPAREASELLTRLLGQSMEREQYHLSAHLGLAQQHLLLSHRDALAFQSMPDSVLEHRVERQMRQFKESWQQLSDQFRNETGVEPIDAVRIRTTRFEEGFVSLVRATRAYLYMVYVVMAGEEVEIARLTAELKEATLAIQASLDRRMNETIATARRDATVITLTAILLGGVLAWRISLGISRPVVAMTRALSDLAQGEMNTEIPGRGRLDEIGSMAKAADVFKQKADALANASRYKSEFLANTSHELRTPLNSLLILSNLLATNSTGNLTDDQVESAHIIHESGSDLLSMINDILDLSKVEAGRMDVLAESMDVDRFLTGLHRQFQHMAAARGLQLRVKMEPHAPPSLVTDWAKVEQIMRNLLSNAFKFTATGEVMVQIGRPRRHMAFGNRSLMEQTVVAMGVTDTGCGIPEDKRELIFEAFQQMDGTTSRQYGGTGLGLSISRKFAQLLGGELQVESEVGRGSTFTLYLPEQFPWSDKVSGTTALAAAQTVGEGGGIDFAAPAVTVLAVDDDKRNGQAISKLLQGRVRQVWIADNGTEALRLLEECPEIDLVLMDIMMPVMDGYQAIQMIRQQKRFLHLPIIALTAKAMPGDRKRCLDVGANAYLSKPVRSEQLFAIMQELLAGAAAEGDSPLREDAPPAHVADAAVSTEPLESPSLMEGGSLTILVVDDDMRTIYSVAKELQSRVATVLLAADGVKALKELESHPEVDAILMDIRMPNLDGYETMRRIRADERFRHVALVAMTALAMPEDVEKCLEAGADGYLAKPASMEHIYAKLEAVLAGRTGRNREEPSA